MANGPAAELSDPSEIGWLVQRLKEGSVDLKVPSNTEGITCTGSDALRILTAADKPGSQTWAGRVVDDLAINRRLEGHLRIDGTIDGRVTVPEGGAIEGSLHIGPDAVINGSVSLAYSGKVGGGISVAKGALIEGDLRILGPVGKDVRIDGIVHGAVEMLEYTSIAGNLVLLENATIGQDLVTDGRIAGDVDIRGEISANFKALGQIKGHLNVWAGPNGRKQATVGGNLEIEGIVGKSLNLYGGIDGVISLQPETKEILTVTALRSATESPIFIGPSVDLSHANFHEFTAFDKLRFLTDRPFASTEGSRQRLTFADPTYAEQKPVGDTTSVVHEAEGRLHDIPPAEQASIYRQLRVALEANSNRPAASDFYYGETEARRNAISHRTKKWTSSEWWILSSYKAVSAYGTRSLRTMAWFFSIAIASAFFLAVNGIEFNPAGTGGTIDREAFVNGNWSWSDRFALLLFTVRSMVSFFSPPSGNLSTTEGFLQLALRFVGPALIAQAVLALRERVAR